MSRKIFLLVFVILFSINLSYADYDKVLMLDRKKTIKELKENIDDLDKTKHDISLKAEENGLDANIKSFLRTDLSIKDNIVLGNIVSEYNKNRIRLENELFEASKRLEDTSEIYKELLDTRKIFYENVLDFVDINQYSSYLFYITEQANSYIEEKEVDSDIIKKSEIVNEKISTIEERIMEHRIYMDETIGNLINAQIDERLDFIKNDSTFSALTLEGKIALLNDIIEKIELMKVKYAEDMSLYDDGQLNIKVSNDKKIEICNQMISKFESYKTELLELEDDDITTTK